MLNHSSNASIPSSIHPMFVPTDQFIISAFSKLLEPLVLVRGLGHLNRHNLRPEYLS